MATELVLTLVSANLALGAMLLAVMLGRGAVRHLCGPDAAYRLWLLPPLFGLGQIAASVGSRPLAGALDPRLADLLLVVWLLGMAASLALLAFGQWRMARLARTGRLGPAVIGFLRQRVVMPPDFTTRYSLDEQAAIRAHERAHLLRNDVLANAGMALLQCLCWFNPLVHVAATMMRHDQEMACDATVLDERPEHRRRYAAALLKTQLRSQGLTGAACAFFSHPLETRIRMIASGLPSPFMRVSAGLFFVFVGMALILTLTDDSGRYFGAIARLEALDPPSYLDRL